jgi:hypothetical protein
MNTISLPYATKSIPFQDDLGDDNLPDYDCGDENQGTPWREIAFDKSGRLVYI